MELLQKGQQPPQQSPQHQMLQQQLEQQLGLHPNQLEQLRMQHARHLDQLQHPKHLDPQSGSHQLDVGQTGMTVQDHDGNRRPDQSMVQVSPFNKKVLKPYTLHMDGLPYILIFFSMKMIPTENESEMRTDPQIKRMKLLPNPCQVQYDEILFRLKTTKSQPS